MAMERENRAPRGNSRKRRKCLSTETQRRNGKQVVCPANFTRRMPQKCGFRVISTHSTAVIFHPHITGSPIFHFNCDAVRSRVNRIFY